MADEQQTAFEYLGFTVRRCLRQQSHDEGNRWYIVRVDEGGAELDEDESFRYATPDDAMAGVDTLKEIERNRSVLERFIAEGAPESA